VDGLAHDGGHLGDLLPRRGVVRPALAEDIGPQRAVRSTSSRYSPNVSQFQFMPSASAVPGMSSTPSINWISHSRSESRAGANPTPQFPMTTVVTPCQPEGETSGSQVTWPS
jgi:hypothetical protein